MAEIKRISTPDLLKGMAVIFMIQVHLMELFAQQDLYDSLIGKISLFLGGVPAAPVFMIVMGYFIAFGKKSPGYMINRGIKLFIAGIFLNIGLNCHLIYNFMFNGWEVNIWQYVFGVDIFHLAGLSLIVIALLSPIIKKNWIFPLIIAFAVAGLSTIIEKNDPGQNLLSYIKAFITGGSEWSYFPLIPWLAYPLTGYAYRLFEVKHQTSGISAKQKLILTGVSGVLFIFTAGYATDVSHNLKEYYNHGIVFFLWALSFVVFLSSLFSLLEGEACETGLFKYVKWLGRNVTVVYIFQWLLIGNIATSIFKTQSLAALIIWFAGILALTSILTILWNRFKATYKLDYLKL